ncbi:MAG: nucleotidyltransferase [Cytophagaceae bacterium]|nr:nucleotidyltransferase [Cytophagaceae bacterium]|tara:strand:+ start:295 stop:1299 length:1005 start_codon:yes stop_codon:yes gene_type:complete
MATTVNNAFSTFMKDIIRLDSNRNDLAKKSKNNLVTEIEKFPNDGKFLEYYTDYMSIDYGSFSRKTKIRPLDDIDLMIVLHAQGNWREPIENGYRIRVRPEASKQIALCNNGTDVLNSIKVINKFKDYLSNIHSYKKADIKRNQEAVTLELNSYEWVYDIVPCFITASDNFGKTFFLIPDGKGNWKATDPRIDKNRTTSINGKQQISVLDTIRIMKYWTKRRTAATMDSYFLECLILQHYDSTAVNSSTYIDVELPNLFAYIYHQIHQSLQDPKGFQGDLNKLTLSERNSIQERAKLDYNRSVQARDFERNGKQNESIEKWREIFGSEFPNYTL